MIKFIFCILTIIISVILPNVIIHGLGEVKDVKPNLRDCSGLDFFDGSLMPCIYHNFNEAMKDVKQNQKKLRDSMPATPSIQIPKIPPMQTLPKSDKPPKIYDWNQQKRELCENDRTLFYLIACKIIGTETSGWGEVLCKYYGYKRTQSCKTEYPPDLYYNPPPIIPPLPIPYYCDKPHFGCLRGW